MSALRFVSTLALVGGALAGFGKPAFAAKHRYVPKHSAAVEHRQRQLERVHRRLRAAKHRLHVANVRERDLSRQLHKAQIGLHAATDKLNRYSVRLRQTRRNLDFTKRRLNAAERDFSFQKMLIARRLDGIYKHGKEPFLEFLFGAKTYSSLLDRTYYLGLILNQDLALARSIRSSEERIAAQKETLNHQVNSLHALKQQSAGEQTVYRSIAGKRRNLLGEVRQERQIYAGRVVELEEISARMERELQELIRREQARDETTHHFTGNVGRFLWPVYTHLITSPFGWRMHPLFGRVLFHTGVDIGAAYGSPIHAAADGVVIYAGWYDGYGQAVVIDHGGGVSTLYAHCSSLYVRKGDEVKRGEVIGLVGATGNATGPHLHFEVRENGTAVDPMRWF